MLFVVALLSLSCLLLIWGWMGLRQRAHDSLQAELAAQARALQEDDLDPPSDVEFRVSTARGPGRSGRGDVLCSDGVLLPQVSENDFQASLDGRWLRAGAQAGGPHRLIDRKTRRTWLLDDDESRALESMHWRLPRWSGIAQAGNGVSDAKGSMSEHDFDTWLQQSIKAPAQPMVGVCDLWIPADCVPDAGNEEPPASNTPGNAAVQLGMQRFWPSSLRTLEDPLQPLRQPMWQLTLNGEPHSWIVQSDARIAWSEDGRAFACYGYPLVAGVRSPQLRLGVWSSEHGGQQWSHWKPADHKPWQVALPEAAPQAAPAPELFWEGQLLMQRVRMDIPHLERLHDGRTPEPQLMPVAGVMQRQVDGVIRLRKLAAVHWYWRRSMAAPSRWQAISAPVAGHPLVWTMTHEAREETGASAGYSLQWGEQTLPGVWELEHVIVQGKWAVLFPWGQPALAGGKPSPWVWDGQQLHGIDLPQPMVRMRPAANGDAVELLVISGAGPEGGKQTNAGAWRWPLQAPTAENVTREGWMPAFEFRTIAPDAKGRWQLQPRWREVQQVQHPCADGDYVWRHAATQDTLWWWGGLHMDHNAQWKPDVPRTEGVTITQSGVMLCATGPSACPHPEGDGWVVLECLARSQDDEPHYWKLHWLRPRKQEVRTLELRAYLPLFKEWDRQLGIVWQEGLPAASAQQVAVMSMPASSAAAVASATAALKDQYIVAARWDDAQMEPLKQAAGQLWVRKQDVVYAEAIAARPEWPWPRVQRT